jgi:predicted Zn-dependent protease
LPAAEPIQRGARRLSAGDPAAGLKEFRAILDRDPNNVRVQVNAGVAYIAVGNMGTAIRVTRDYPDDAGAHYVLGIAYKQIDDLAPASAELE